MANYNISLLLSATGTFSASNRLQNITVGDTLTVTVNNYISGYRGWNAYIPSTWQSGGTFSPMPAQWTGTYSNGPIVFTSTGQGSGYYTIRIYAVQYSPYTYRSGRIYGSVAAGAASYSLSAPTQIVEGNVGTISVTATNHTPSTHYWSVTPAADFVNSQGTDYIPSNGSSTFNVQPTSDGSTEGNETATVRLYTDSSRTNQVASDTFVIVDPSGGSGGGGSTGGSSSGGSGTYGINVFSQSGTKVFGTDLRTQNVEVEQSISIPGNSTSSAIAMADANDSSKCVITLVGNAFDRFANFTINTTSTGFTITNNASGAKTANVLAFRIG